MKKLIHILFACLLVVTTLLGAVACGGDQPQAKEAGVYASKINGVFTLTQYVDDGKTTNVDLGAMVKAKYGEDLVRIKAGAFDGNGTITSLVVPNTVTEIDGGAFRGMTALERITLPFVGANVNADAFSNETDSSADKAVNAERNFGYVFANVRYEGSALINMTYTSGEGDTATYYIPYTLKTVVIAPKSEYKVPMFAFNGLTQIATVELSDKVIGIGDKAFANSTIHTIKLGVGYQGLLLGQDWDKNTNENLKIYDINGLVER